MKIINCALTVLSPLHISGSAAEVNNIGFYYDQKYLYHINEKKMAAALKEEGLVESFVNFMGSGRGSLQEYLELLPHIPRESLRGRLGGKKIALEKQGGRINTFRLFQQDPLTGNPYIPGSSIKGVLRSVILLMLLDRGALSHERIESAIRESTFKDRARAGNIVSRLLESAELEHTKPGPHRDWLRGLKVSDAFCHETEPSSIRETKVVSLNKNGGGFHWGARDASIYVETIKPGVVFSFSLELDSWLLQIMGRSARRPQFDLEELFDNDMIAKYISGLEQRFWEQGGLPALHARQQRHLAGGTCLRMGWGSGYLNTTVGAFLADNARMKVGQVFYRTRYDVFPNSRKVVVENGKPVDTLGWCRLGKL